MAENCDSSIPSSTGEAIHDQKNESSNQRNQVSSATGSSQRQGWKRMALVFLTANMTIFYTGAFFGWGPMQLLLEEDGAFQDECDNGGNGVNGNNIEEDTSMPVLPCPDQTSKLINVHFYAQFALMASPIFGMLVDTYGPCFMMGIATIFLATGLGCLILAVARNIDPILYVAFLGIGMTTISSHQNILQTGMLFQGKTQQRVISVMNALFDAGALTYLGLWWIREWTNVELEWLIGSYLLVGACIFGMALSLWSVVVPVSQHEKDDPEISKGVAEDPAMAESEAVQDDKEQQQQQQQQIEQEQSDDVEEEADRKTHNLTVIIDSDSHGGGVTSKLMNKEMSDDKQEVDGLSMKEEDPIKSNEIIAASSQLPTDRSSLEQNIEYVLISDRSTIRQLLSKQYLLLLAFFSFHSAHNVFMLTTARDFLAYLGDDETGNRYLSIFVLMTPVSILGLPFMDHILNRYGYHAGFQSINLLAMSYCLVKVASDSLQVQVLGFLLFSMFRCFIFTISFSYLPTFLGQKVVGRGAGFMVLSQGVTSLINIPLASWAVNELNGNFFLPNLLYTLGCLPFVYVAWIMGTGVQQEAKATIAADNNKRQMNPKTSIDS